MTYNLLLYGATGYTGRLIAAEGQWMGMSRAEPRGDCRMILAARNGAAVSRVARERSMDYRVFSLDNPAAIRRNLDAIDVVINAAGPFKFTAVPLAQAALDAGCHYVDINGELDVYVKLRDLASKDSASRLAIVSGAGASAAASDVLFVLALQKLLRGQPLPQGLGAVRIAHSKVMDASRGSVLTAARLLHDEVIVARASKMAGCCECAGPSGPMVVCYEPVCKLERAFDFCRPNDDREASAHSCSSRIAAAINAVDTLTAMYTVERLGLTARAIESYLQMGTVDRFAYHFAATLSPLCALPHLRGLIEAPLSLLPEGPSRKERDEDRHVIVIEIEDVFGSRVLEWKLQTPNVYQLTAQLVVAIATAVAHRPGAESMGWVTPADALGLAPFGVGSLRGCTLHARMG
jgi:short subunit dehydrogenase-like uncharacterized protein